MSNLAKTYYLTPGSSFDIEDRDLSSFGVALEETGCPLDEGRGWAVRSQCYPVDIQAPKFRTTENWRQNVPILLGNLANTAVGNLHEAVRVSSLQQEIVFLKQRVSSLEKNASMVVPIETLTPAPYKLIKAIHVVVRRYDNDYLTSFFDANLSASGDTQEESVLNLKDIIVSTFEMLLSMDNDMLGPGPLQQKRVLGDFLKEKE